MGTYLLLSPASMVAASIYTVVVELFLPFGLWWRRTRGLCIALGLALHLTIAVTLEIYAFSIVMLASYLLFLDRRPRLRV